jgi:hypothetical protein
MCICAPYYRHSGKKPLLFIYGFLEEVGWIKKKFLTVILVAICFAFISSPFLCLSLTHSPTHTPFLLLLVFFVQKIRWWWRNKWKYDMKYKKRNKFFWAMLARDRREHKKSEISPWNISIFLSRYKLKSVKKGKKDF